jgi:hypothetical protein
MNRRKLEQLRMLMDWQLRQLGYDPDLITRLCMEADERVNSHEMVSISSGFARSDCRQG